MVVPAAGTIEMARDSLLTLDQAHKDDQVKELRGAIGDDRGKLDFEYGYLLGLQTARVYLAGMPAAVKNKVSI
jgi:hypothetical protein